jgi:hypothetical protein
MEYILGHLWKSLTGTVNVKVFHIVAVLTRMIRKTVHIPHRLIENNMITFKT